MVDGQEITVCLTIDKLFMIAMRKIVLLEWTWKQKRFYIYKARSRTAKDAQRFIPWEIRANLRIQYDGIIRLSGEQKFIIS